VHIAFWCGKLKIRDHLEDTGVDGRVMLKWILKESVGRFYSGLICLRLGTGGDFENSDEPSGFRKCRECFE
jgi:hypothetical protein